MLSYAQNKEGLILDTVFREQTVGFYVDVDTNHPQNHSITRLFYDRGWRGLNIVTSQASQFAFQRARPKDITIVASKNPPGNTLSALFDDLHQNRIDFLHTGHSEFAHLALSGLNFERFRPVAIMIEAPTSGDPPHQSLPGSIDAHHPLHAWLISAGYEFTSSEGLRLLYLRGDMAGMHTGVAAPHHANGTHHRPGTGIDTTLSHRLRTLEREQETLERRIAGREQENARLSETLASLTAQLQDKQRRNDDLHAENQTLHQELEQSRQREAGLIKANAAQRDLLKQQLEAALAQMRDYESENAKLRQEAASLRQQLQDLHGHYSALLASREKSLHELERRLSEAIAESREHHVTIKTLRQRLAERTAALRATRNRLNRLAEEETKLGGKLGGEDGRVVALRAQIAALRNSFKSREIELQSEILNMTSANAEQVKTIAEQDFKVAHLQDALAGAERRQQQFREDHETALRSLSNRIAQLETCVEHSRLSNAAKDKIIEELNKHAWWKRQSTIMQVMSGKLSV